MRKIIKEEKFNSKDYYYMGIAKEVSKASKCLSRKIGAVLIKHDAIISTGYNGPPRGIQHCQHHAIIDNRLVLDVIEKSDDKTCPRKRAGFISGEGMDFCIAGHAEENAIVQSARIGISTINAKMYCYCSIPCVKCCIKIINAGISDVYCLDSEWGTSKYDFNLSKQLLENSGTKTHFMKFD